MSDNPYTIGHFQPFDPSVPEEALCERERHAAHRFHLSRLRHRKPDQSATFIGGTVALAAFWLSMIGEHDRDDAKLRFDAIMDYAWAQACSMADDLDVTGLGTSTVQ